MRRGLHSRPAALAIASIALFVALGGSVYAAQKINGKQIKPKSLPGNRLALESVPGNRLKPGSVSSAQLAPGAVSASQLAPGSVTGIQVDVATLGQVPSSVHAENADAARDAQTALNAVNALDAQRVNGHSAGCQPDTRFCAGSDRRPRLRQPRRRAAGRPGAGGLLAAARDRAGERGRVERGYPRRLSSQSLRSCDCRTQRRNHLSRFQRQPQIPLRDPARHLTNQASSRRR